MSAITVIVPVYNVEAYLPRCVDSILAQTFTDFELILVDDGSPDRCGEICDEYAAKDTRVRVIHKENGGVSSARNAGIKIAKGEYITFVDSDDYVASDYIECMYSNRSDLTICGQEARNERNDTLRTIVYLPERFDSKRVIPFSKLYAEVMLYSPYCKLFRNDLIQNHGLQFPLSITWGEDGMFVADYIRYINSFATVKNIGYYYIRYDREESLSTKVRADIIDMIVTSREYCINRMAETSPQDYDTVKTVCSEDIRKNCAYFVKKLIDCSSITARDKKRILQRFMAYPYVTHVISNPQIYFAYDVQFQSIFSKHTAGSIVKAYKHLRRKQHIWLWLYQYFYKWQPKAVKDIVKSIRKR